MTRFGLLVPHFGEEADQDLLVEGARLADRLGFDSLWVRDHLVFHPHGMEGTDRTFIEPLVTLTYLAAVTERIGLGAATIIPFRNPINLAYSIASMSWLTRRRFDLGIGAGNFQHEFDVIGQGTLKRPELMKEQAHQNGRYVESLESTFSQQRGTYDLNRKERAFAEKNYEHGHNDDSHDESRDLTCHYSRFDLCIHKSLPLVISSTPSFAPNIKVLNTV